MAEAIEEIETQRARVDASQSRVSYFDQKRFILDRMVSLQLERFDRPDLALQFSERAKARVLGDWLSLRQDSLAELPPSGVEHRDIDSQLRNSELPEDSLILYFSVLPKRTAIWLLRREEAAIPIQLEIGAQELTALVVDFYEALSNDHGARAADYSERLYDRLIRPVRNLLRDGERLIFVPDGVLHWLPFSLLQDAQQGEPLLSKHAIAISPSLRALTFSVQSAQSRHIPSQDGVLAVLTPEYEESRGLKPLYSKEAWQAIEDYFPLSRLLANEDATTKGFLDLAPQFGILHFGGHSFLNRDLPLLSQLHFSAEKDLPGSGMLLSKDILGMKLPATNLVVLASCQSGFGDISPTEGVESLARSFLAVGVPAVVVALWEVNDRKTAAFFSRFYSFLYENPDPIEALRQTQLELWRQYTQRDEDWTWAAFVAIGGEGPAWRAEGGKSP